MKTKKQIEKQELKYAPGDKVVYRCAGTDRSGTIMYVDDTDKVAPYRIGGMNIRESDIVEKVMKKRGRPPKKQVEAKVEVVAKEEVVVNAEPKQKPEETQVVEFRHVDRALESLILLNKCRLDLWFFFLDGFNHLVDLVTADTKKMRELMAKSMQSIANDCGLKA